MAELFFDRFRLDTRAQSLDGPDGEVRIRARTMAVLLYLIDNRGRFVPRAELLEQLWQGVHVTDASLTQCISELRQALDDSSRRPRIIATKIKRGYCFVATLYHKPTERLEPLPPPPGLAGSRWRQAGTWVVLAVALVVAAAAVAIVMHVWPGAGERGGAAQGAAVADGPVRIRIAMSVPDEAGPRLERIVELTRHEVETAAAEIDGVELATGPDAPGADGRWSAHTLEIRGRDVHELRLELTATIRRPDGGRIWGFTIQVPASDPQVEMTAERLATAAVEGIELLLAGS
jgi:DNA-binding winged helix-turn-helix (wHTH) protein